MNFSLFARVVKTKDWNSIGLLKYFTCRKLIESFTRNSIATEQWLEFPTQWALCQWVIKLSSNIPSFFAESEPTQYLAFMWNQYSTQFMFDWTLILAIDMVPGFIGPTMPNFKGRSKIWALKFRMPPIFNLFASGFIGISYSCQHSTGRFFSLNISKKNPKN